MIYNYNWEIMNGFSKKQYEDMIQDYNKNSLAPDDCIGQVRIGNLCFDVVTRQYDSLVLDFDLYVGGVDTGYGYSTLSEEYPYDYADGSNLDSMENIRTLSYEQFVKFAENIFTNFLQTTEESYEKANNVSLARKAKEPLMIW